MLPLLLVALLKALLPSERLRRACNGVLTGMAESWIGQRLDVGPSFTQTRSTSARTRCHGRNGHYLVLANHQSWSISWSCKKVFNRRIPFMRFFLKRQLIWCRCSAWHGGAGLPVHAAATRRSRSRSVRNWPVATSNPPAAPAKIPRAAGGDRISSKARFTPAKHAAQGAPYRRLLKPKSGGVAFVLTRWAMACRYAILDVSIAYPGGSPTLLDLLSDSIPEVRVRCANARSPTRSCAATTSTTGPSAPVSSSG